MAISMIKIRHKGLQNVSDQHSTDSCMLSNSTQKWSSQLKREIGFNIVARCAKAEWMMSSSYPYLLIPYLHVRTAESHFPNPPIRMQYHLVTTTCFFYFVKQRNVISLTVAHSLLPHICITKQIMQHLPFGRGNTQNTRLHIPYFVRL
jgi:hypothetical protein